MIVHLFEITKPNSAHDLIHFRCTFAILIQELISSIVGLSSLEISFFIQASSDNGAYQKLFRELVMNPFFRTGSKRSGSMIVVKQVLSSLSQGHYHH